MYILAIECGATSSEAFLVDKNENTKKKMIFGSANYQLIDESQLESFFSGIQKYFREFEVEAIGVGMPGILDDLDKQCVGKVIRKLWPDVKALWVGNDLQTALASIDNEYELRVVVVAGTGSCSYGTNGENSGKVGGYGHRIGDRGSGYALGEKAIRLALRQHEHNCPLMQVEVESGEEVSSAMLSAIMKQIGILTIKQLVIWMLSAKKEEIASLAPLVLLKWKDGDELAKSVVEEAIQDLSADCICLVNKLLKTLNQRMKEAADSPNFNIRLGIGLTGSLFTKDADFADAFKKRLASQLATTTPEISSGNCWIDTLENTALGCVKALRDDNGNSTYFDKDSNKGGKISADASDEEILAENILPVALGLSLTEQRNAKSMNLDRMPVEDAIDLMIDEERSIFEKIREHKESIGILVHRVCTAFQNGGRLFYVGCGTSGRLGILDATECPPTFRSPHEWVQGIIAGGFSSVSVAKEGAEDSITDGIKAVEDRMINSKDIVIGIAACGRTPFVWGSIHRGKSLGAFTAFLTFNTELRLKIEPDLFISMNLGAEVLTGSTRLKCGTATKCILNMLSTLAMVKYGKCFENLMVDLNPANQKLKQRSLRIVRLMTSHVKGISEQEAKHILIANNYDIRKTVQAIRALNS